jgi:drug/metabolite transporter (DMT)-like permease
MSKRQIALIKLLITAMLWGNTYVLVSMGLQDMGPLTLAGIRYTLAGLILLPVIRSSHLKLRDYKDRFWQLAALGICALTLGNGFASMALQHLPSTSVSLMSNLSVLLIMGAGAVFLNESPGLLQILGVLIVFVGMGLFFNPGEFGKFNIGYIFVLISLVSYSAYNLLGRFVARSRTVPFLVQTAVPFIIGGSALLLLGFIFEGIPILTTRSLLIILFMVIFNSITGFTLYNQALADLTAMEVNIILKLQPFFTAFYAWLLLGEKITFMQIGAMMVVFTGIYLVQRAPMKLQDKILEP